MVAQSANSCQERSCKPCLEGLICINNFVDNGGNIHYSLP